jgi:hypothetical protein
MRDRKAVSMPILERKVGNTIYEISGEYSTTATKTLNQVLEQIMLNRLADMKWSETPLDFTPETSEDYSNR